MRLYFYGNKGKKYLYVLCLLSIVQAYAKSVIYAIFAIPGRLLKPYAKS